MLPNRLTLLTINLILIATTILWLNVDGTQGMKKKMFRKLKSMLTHKAKKLIILPIPIPFMMDDKKFGGLGGMLGGGGHMMSSINQGMDPWMMMSMMDCPEMMVMGDNHNLGSSETGSGGFHGSQHQENSGKTYFTEPGMFMPPSGHHGQAKPEPSPVDSWGSMQSQRGQHGGKDYRGNHRDGSKVDKVNPGNYFKGQSKEMDQVKQPLSSY